MEGVLLGIRLRDRMIELFSVSLSPCLFPGNLGLMTVTWPGDGGRLLHVLSCHCVVLPLLVTFYGRKK